MLCREIFICHEYKNLIISTLLKVGCPPNIGGKGRSVLQNLSWVFMCFFRWSFLPNCFPHAGKWQIKGFTPVWILLCLVSSSFLVNVFPQLRWVHLYGLSPVCILMCPLNWPLLLKLESHLSHLYFFCLLFLSANCFSSTILWLIICLIWSSWLISE